MKIAVAGLGFMGAKHVRAIASLPGVELAGVVSASPRKLAGDLSEVRGNLGDAGTQFDFGAALRCRELAALLAEPAIDAVSICLPTYLHADAAIAALRAGKHVLVEKPMALDPSDAARMISEAHGAGRILMVAHVLRFFPAYRALAETIHGASAGRLRFLDLRRRCAAPVWSGWFARLDRSGGAVLDLLIHDVDFCLSLFGRPESCTAAGHRDLERGIDVLSAELDYGAFDVAIRGGWHHPHAYPFSMGYTAVFDGGTLEYDSREAKPRFYGADGNAADREIAESDPYADQIAYFAECCRTGQQPDFCPPEASAEAVALARELAEAR